MFVNESKGKQKMQCGHGSPESIPGFPVGRRARQRKWIDIGLKKTEGKEDQLGLWWRV